MSGRAKAAMRTHVHHRTRLSVPPRRLFATRASLLRTPCSQTLEGLASLASLRKVRLDRTGLTGPFPPASSQWLRSMSVSGNRLSGNLSIQGGQLSDLDVSANQLTVLSRLEGLGSLRSLRAQNNRFAGSGLRLLDHPMLEHLDLSFTPLGALPGDLHRYVAPLSQCHAARQI